MSPKLSVEVPRLRHFVAGPEGVEVVIRGLREPQSSTTVRPPSKVAGATYQRPPARHREVTPMQVDPTPRVDSRRWKTFDRNVQQLEQDGRLRPRFRFVKDDPRTGRQVKKILAAVTREQARTEAGKLRDDLSRGKLSTGDRSLTVEQLAASFLEKERGPLGRLSPRTVDLYAQRLASHVVPALGPRTKVADVQVQDIRRMIDRVAAKHSGSTAHGCRSVASALLRHAVRDLGAIDRNPVRDLERGDLPSAKRTSEPRYLSVQEVERLLAHLSDESRPVAAACFYGGLRISEALSVLRWGDVDIAAKSINVRGTKTAASAATIPLLPALAAELALHRERQGRQGFGRIAQDALVFSTSSGKPISRRNLLRAVQSAAERAGLVAEGQEPIGCHDLRHSLAANAFGLGLSPAEVARLLRHANPRVTLTIYAGLTDDAVASLGEKMAAMRA